MLGRRTMVVLVALAATLASGGAQAASTVTIALQDAIGDATGGAPDIRSASLRDDGRGTLTFSVDLVGRTELVPDDQLRIYLDTDNNPATGDDDGIDYLIFADASSRELSLWRWTGDGSMEMYAPTLTTVNGLTISLHHRHLGGTRAFSAVFRSRHASNAGASDEAGPVSFVMPPATPPTRLTVPQFSLSPTKPRAGKLFVASAVIETDTGVLVYEGTVRCAATIAGRKVKPAGRGRFIKLINVGQSEPADADASCMWTIPRGTAGKTIRGTITVTSRGMSVRKSFATRIVR